MKPARRWHRSRFDQPEEEPLGPMANLVDLMLVFVCGLVAALVAISPDLSQNLRQTPSQTPRVEQGRELPKLPDSLKGDGSGYQSVGKVYRDPETGKLILVSDD